MFLLDLSLRASKASYKTGHCCFLGLALRCSPKMTVLLSFAGGGAEWPEILCCSEVNPIWYLSYRNPYSLGIPYSSHYVLIHFSTCSLPPQHVLQIFIIIVGIWGMDTKCCVPPWELQTPHLPMGRPSRICSFFMSLWKSCIYGLLYQWIAEPLSRVF